MKRENSLQKLYTALREDDIRFPCGEEPFYNFLQQETTKGAPSSRLKSFFEALAFVRYVLGVEALQDLTESRRCTGAAFTRSLKCPTQAEPFTVKQLQNFSCCVEGISYGWLLHPPQGWTFNSMSVPDEGAVEFKAVLGKSDRHREHGEALHRGLWLA